MYFPKSQIETGLYTNGGEYRDTFTKEEYVGPYFKTSAGELYSGRNPQDSPIRKLEVVPAIVDSESGISLTADPMDSSYRLDPTYAEIKGIDTERSAPHPPVNYYPSPTDEDRNNGEFIRYFLRKVNEVRFVEVDKTSYDKFRRRDETVLYESYIPFTMFWDLSDDASKINATRANRIEREKELYGFVNYLRENFNKFSN